MGEKWDVEKVGGVGTDSDDAPVSPKEKVGGVGTDSDDAPVSPKEKGSRAAGPAYKLWMFMIAVLFISFYSIVFLPSRSRKLIQLCKNNCICVRYIDKRGGGDIQLDDFLDNLKLSTSLLIFHVLLGRLLGIFSWEAKWVFNLALSAGLIYWFYAWQAIFVLLVVFLGYVIAERLKGTRLLIPVTWGYILYVVYAKDHNGWPFNGLSTGHDVGGLFPWHYQLKILVLRISSFMFDWHHSTSRSSSSSSSYRKTSSTVSNEDSSVVPQADEKIRPRSYRPNLRKFSFTNMLVYVLYVPLFVAGPIICFDDFYGQMTHRWGGSKKRRAEVKEGKLQEKKTVIRIGLYAILCYALYWMLIHYIQYVPSFALFRSGVASNLSGSEYAQVVVMHLVAMWLKFSFIWKYARLWSMLDGITPPENMPRYIAHNVTVGMFWSGWHVSFNRWIIRYLYKPMGGRNTRQWNLFIVFAFAAGWHEMNLQLVTWGLLNCVFIGLDDTIARVLKRFCDEYFTPFHGWFFERVIKGIRGTISLAILTVINIVGFAVGTDGIQNVHYAHFLDAGYFLLLGGMFAHTQIYMHMHMHRKKE